MKKFCFLTILFIYTFALSAKKSEPDSLFSVLDYVIENSDMYVQQRELQIGDYKQMFNIPKLTAEQEYEINLKLYDTYYSFKPDSAIVYMKRNIQIAENLNNETWLVESKLRLSSSYTLKSMFIDAINLIESISVERLNDNLLRRYYSDYLYLYSHYPHGRNEDIESRMQVFRDSIRNLTDKKSPSYLEQEASRLYSEEKCSDSRDVYFEMYKDIEIDTHEQAKIANMIAHTYRCEGNYEMQKKYFAIASIADIRNGVKENAALRSLAIACYETNDIERAYRYIYKSMEDAMYANISFRIVEISQIFPIIERSYQEKVHKQKSRLSLLLICIGILSFFLVIAVFYVSVQMQKLKKARQALSDANTQLSRLNEDLKKSNEEKTKANNEIRKVNQELSEANMLKETYISQFLTICSMYIKKLENYQNTLNKKALENRTSELFRMLKSRDMVENELKELYNLFDTIFLNLYPDFVEEFNALLPENERFSLKSTELLNTELRIFALIRLGITDSSKIAEFLHYSIATIYNYRTRVRNKAIVPSEDFECIVMKIGAI